MNPLLIKQFEYDKWANLLWIDYILTSGAPETYTQIMSHILGAQMIWVTRIEGESLTSTLEDIALHVANHCTYHRGELRGLCRADSREGFPETDRIRFTYATS